jgi:GNAT superfamily N-acetyltransferase
MADIAAKIQIIYYSPGLRFAGPPSLRLRRKEGSRNYPFLSQKDTPLPPLNRGTHCSHPLSAEGEEKVGHPPNGGEVGVSNRLQIFLIFTPMNIRPATLADVAPIMQVINQVVPTMRAAWNYQWDNTYPNPAVFEEDIKLNQLWVADMDGDIGGVAAITTDQYEGYADAGLDITETAIVVHRLAVNPKYQGKGIAAALMQKAEDEAIRTGINLLRIDTNTHNQATQKLFPKLGYVFAGEMGIAFRPGLRFYCYEKRL